MSRITCLLCNKKYLKNRVVFTQTHISIEKQQELNLPSGIRWIDACPWCFDKTVEHSKPVKYDSDEILDVFRSFSAR